MPDLNKFIIEDYKMDLPMEFMKKWLVSEKDNNLTPEAVEKEMSNIEKQVKWDVVSNQFATQNEIKVEFEEIKDELYSEDNLDALVVEIYNNPQTAKPPF
jgi:trigger factor